MPALRTGAPNGEVWPWWCRPTVWARCAGPPWTSTRTQTWAGWSSRTRTGRLSQRAPARPWSGPPADLSGDVAQRVLQVLEQQINPGIAAHGGRADLVAVEDDAVYLRLSGGCAGCGMATVTLSQGIEVALRESVPEILQVIDVTDHAAGTNPYYEAAKK